jgi:hypothetical protein
MLGDRAAAERVLSELLDHFPGEWVPGVDVAAIYNGLGDRAMVFKWLERARELRCFDALFIADDPRFRNLLSDVRFQALSQR